MFAVYADSFSFDDPLSGLVVGERPDPAVPDGWTAVRVKAASLNHHDLWSLRGVGLRQEALPMILGCDAAGLDEDGVMAFLTGAAFLGEALEPRNLAGLAFIALGLGLIDGRPLRYVQARLFARASS